MQSTHTAFRFLIACCACLLAGRAATAEEITFTSASPYQLAEILQAEEPAYELEMRADLSIPESVRGPMPAFVFLHGSSGPLARHGRYLELARNLGFATLQLNSFAPRGISSTIGNQANATAAMMATDLLRALKYLSARPDIDPGKIVVMGSSKGAIAALYASWAPVRRKVAGDLDFAGYLLLYPLCTEIEDGNVTRNPVRVFIGEKDNWTPAAPCIAQAEKMKASGRDWSIKLYKDAYHAFDANIDGIREMPNAYSMETCQFALRSDGYEYEKRSGFLLTKSERLKAFRSCARKGSVKIGGHHAAAALLDDVRSVLESVRR